VLTDFAIATDIRDVQGFQVSGIDDCRVGKLQLGQRGACNRTRNKEFTTRVKTYDSDVLDLMGWSAPGRRLEKKSFSACNTLYVAGFVKILECDRRGKFEVKHVLRSHPDIGG